jgi:hypothetical protein
MSKNFSQNQSPEQNVKISIDKILGKDTTLKRKRKSANDLKKETFCQFLSAMTFLDVRNQELNNKWMMPMDHYDEPFMKAIDLILKLSFNSRQLEVIYFYLYERIDITGKEIAMKDDNDKIIPTTNPEEVWIAVQSLA